MSVFRLPRITTAQRTPLVLELGELVYDTDLNAVFRGNGSTAGGLPFGGASLSNAIALALGTASAGAAVEASRADHVHPLPTAAAIGAEVAGAVAAHEAASDPHPQYLTPAEANAAYAPLSHVGAGASAHAAVVAGGNAGFMTGADKTKLDGIAAGATVGANWAVNLTNIPANIASWAGIAPTAKQDTLTSSTSNTVSGTQVQRAALTGDVTAAANSNATTITNDAVTNAKLANMATATLKGRATAGTGDPEDLTAAQARTLLNVANGATANATDAALRDRATHTGAQAASTISDFAAASRAQAEAFIVAGTNVTIAYSGSGATRTATINATGGGGTWGSITGTLSAQTDLQAALDAKLDDSQATTAGLALLGAADAAAQRSALGVAPSVAGIAPNQLGSWNVTLGQWEGATEIFRASQAFYAVNAPANVQPAWALRENNTLRFAWYFDPASNRLGLARYNDSGILAGNDITVSRVDGAINFNVTFRSNAYARFITNEGTNAPLSNANGAAGGFEAQARGTGAACFSFHRPGLYAVHFGLDTDNQVGFGGWSMGANRVILSTIVSEPGSLNNNELPVATTVPGGAAHVYRTWSRANAPGNFYEVLHFNGAGAAHALQLAYFGGDLQNYFIRHFNDENGWGGTSATWRALWHSGNSLRVAGFSQTGRAATYNIATGEIEQGPDVLDSVGNLRHIPTVAISGATTLSASAHKGCRLRKSGATALTVTADPGLPVGFSCVIRNANAAGNITIARGSGVSIRIVGSGTDANATLAPWGEVLLSVEDTNTIVLSGSGVS